MRFQTVDVPNGATIDVAYLSFSADGIDGGIPQTILKGEDVDDAATFSTAGDYDGRDRTAASVLWTPPAWVTGTWYDTPDMKTIAQEIVDRPGWVANQDMAFFWSHAAGWGGVSERLQAEAYDGTQAEAPKLHIEYTAGGPEWKQLQYTSEPPTPNAWNQLKQEAGAGYVKLLFEGE